MSGYNLYKEAATVTKPTLLQPGSAAATRRVRRIIGGYYDACRRADDAMTLGLDGQ